MVKQKKSKEPVIAEAQPTLVNGNKNVVKNVTPTKMDTTPIENGIVKERKPKSPKLTLNEALDKLEPKVEDDEPAAGGGSMAVLLTQGIMANDPVKVDSVLRTMNIDVIRATLKDIQAMHVIPFLKAIEHRLRTRQAGIIRPWIRWLQCTFSIHMAFLVSQRNLESELGALLEWMRARVGHQEQLLALHGKVSVISEQIERRLNRGTDVVHQPLIVFNNDDNMDSDLDDLESLGSDDSGASSEEDWWDEPGMRDDDDNENEDDDDDEDIDSDEEFSKQVRRTNEEDDSDDDDEDGSGLEDLANANDTDDEEDDEEENGEEMDVS